MINNNNNNNFFGAFRKLIALTLLYKKIIYLKPIQCFFITLIWKINEIINYELGDMKARCTVPHKQERFEGRFKR